MPVRPNRCYRQLKGRPYTKKEYISGIPGKKIVTFDMGARTAKFPVKATLYADEMGQVRHNSLEASRVMANRYLMKATEKWGYHLKIRVYPHHILRENSMATGAGADRYQTGMRGSFGRPVGCAARVQKGQPLMSVWVYENKESIARESLRRARMKLPMPCHSDIEYVEVDESKLDRIAELEKLEEEREARRKKEEARERAAAEAALLGIEPGEAIEGVEGLEGEEGLEGLRPEEPDLVEEELV